MDLSDTIRQLRAERAQLEMAIAQLEALAGNGNRPVHKHRGRKFMGPAERRQVSERMRRYWAGRKARSAGS